MFCENFKEEKENSICNELLKFPMLLKKIQIGPLGGKNSKSKIENKKMISNSYNIVEISTF